MKNISDKRTNKTNTPFYLTMFWFSTLARIVFINDKRVDLNKGGRILPHIEKTVKFHFLKLRALKSLTNFYSPEFLPESGSSFHESNEIAPFYENSEDFKGYDLIDLNPLSEQNADSIVLTLENNGYFCEKYYTSTNWTHPDISNQEAFWDIRPNTMKNILKRKRTKIFRDHNCKIKILSGADEFDVSEMLQDYHDVYNKSWKNNEPYTQFIDALAIEEHKTGKLRLGVLYCNNTAVAAQIWFVDNATAYIFKLSYDNALRTESVGSILMEAMFNHVITIDKVTSIDFLTGNDKYKADWMTTSRPLFGIKAYNRRTLRGLICILSIKTKKILKQTREKTNASDAIQ